MGVSDVRLITKSVDTTAVASPFLQEGPARALLPTYFHAKSPAQLTRKPICYVPLA